MKIWLQADIEFLFVLFKGGGKKEYCRSKIFEIEVKLAINDLFSQEFSKSLDQVEIW